MSGGLSRCPRCGAWEILSEGRPHEAFNAIFQERLYELIDSKANGLADCTVTEIIDIAAAAFDASPNPCGDETPPTSGDER